MESEWCLNEQTMKIRILYSFSWGNGEGVEDGNLGEWEGGVKQLVLLPWIPPPYMDAVLSISNKCFTLPPAGRSLA